MQRNGEIGKWWTAALLGGAVLAAGLGGPAWAQMPAAGAGAIPAPATAAAPGPGGEGAGAGALTAPDPTQALIERLVKETLRMENPVPADGHRAVREQSDRTAQVRSRAAPKMATVMRDVPLDPASPIPVVKFDLSQLATITFIDMSGEPWPILDNGCDVSAGFEGAAPKGGTHVLVLRAVNEVDHGTAVCRLQGLNTPIGLRLEAGSHEHYLRFDARVPRLGPKAKVAPYDLGGTQLVAGDDTMSGFLYGVVPPDAVSLPVDKGNGRTRAWRLGTELFVRSSMVLLSPTPTAMSSLEGVYVYRLKPVPVLRFDDDGNDVEIKIAGAKVVRATVPADVLGDGAVIAAGGRSDAVGSGGLTLRDRRTGGAGRKATEGER
ncbi:DotH/IcmK family type IV secretion protein [Azospirillum canadense]|uniref:DotH/IcmK family type IV secretion protein n=1 Tax=Azospirillum canadense TaxID=403962 RepID=UPI0022260ECA|nr:DotH/IcmK family type IV secretion protein [Azospirillum canadense]MCW2240377.1 intracellular multiplication protein IcmK [Azospirillum canadense]